MEPEDPNTLFNKYLKGECTPSEKALVDTWLNKRFVSNKWEWKDEQHKLDVEARIRKHVEKGIIYPPAIPLKASRILLWAASIAVFVGIVFFLNRRGAEKLVVSQTVTKSVNPGSKFATLTLDDGSVISLDGSSDSVLAKKKHIIIKKLRGGRLVYETTGLSKVEKPFINTINIPLGGQYQVTLPDGTHVWLNSASSLSYPSYFTGTERQVQLTGEAYFEVAKNTEMPFKVKAGDINIRVTGTHFNVSAYEDNDRILTTLLEGSVEVVKNSKKIRLYPGQQAVSSFQSAYFISRSVDAEAAIAWKNGYFVFEDQDIESVMKDVARWYNVEVIITGKTKTGKKVGGTFSRSKSLEDLLLYLEKLEVAKFKKEGRKITVMI